MQNLFAKMNQIKLVSNMIWPMDILKKIDSDKVLRNKDFNIAKTPNYEKYQRDLASMVFKFFDKKTKVSGIKNEIKQNKTTCKWTS